MTDWSQLSDAYGPAGDIPDLLAQAEPDGRIWDELWSRLCHQGTVYPASFAALPILTEIAGRWSATERLMPLALAGAIVSSDDPPFGYPDPRDEHASQIARLLTLTEETLASAGLDDDHYIVALQALLAFEGVKVWSQHLDGLTDGEYEVYCPGCDEESFVAFGEYGTFSTQDDMYMRNTGSRRLPLIPAEPAELRGIGERLHARATGDGHPAVAAKLTYVFGQADCPACGERFRVDEAIAAMLDD